MTDVLVRNLRLLASGHLRSDARPIVTEAADLLSLQSIEIERLREALQEIANRPGAGMDYAKGCGEWPIGEAENMARIASQTLSTPSGGLR